MKTIKILIAEDEKSIREMYATAFMREQFTVYTAPDGKAAIEKFKAKQPDIILLDIMMPGLDGYATLKEIRKKHDKYVPVIMLTNLDMEHFVQHDSVDHIDDYLVKANFTPAEVVEKTKEVLRLNKLID